MLTVLVIPAANLSAVKTDAWNIKQLQENIRNQLISKHKGLQKLFPLLLKSKL